MPYFTARTGSRPDLRLGPIHEVKWIIMGLFNDRFLPSNAALVWT